MSVYEIPQQQRAAVRAIDDPTKFTTMELIDVPQPGPNQILVKITWSGVCGTDKSLLRDDGKDLGFTMKPESKGIAGHEGVGIVVAVGEDVQERWDIGDRAGIKWIAGVCGECEFCQEGDDIHCQSQNNSGFSWPGTFQEYCLADGQYSTKIPDGVTDQEAAPILCAGVTAYAACKKSEVNPGQWIVIPGAGGGLGHLAVQYAHAMGMRVIAIDTGEQKRKLCGKLGAEAFIDFKTSQDVTTEVRRLTKYGAHGVLVIAASKDAFATAPSFLRPRGTVVVVGVATDPSVLAGAPPALLTMMQLRIVGSLAANLKEVEEAFDLSARGLVRPIVSEGILEELDSWIDKLEAGQVAGRVVLQVSN
ncbi:chaperonin 10-like protein [Ilyonectria destructans]|nr:chaperonin 10-like protein [Ilyonectria destructans]